jgi:hypothetical protein
MPLRRSWALKLLAVMDQEVTARCNGMLNRLEGTIHKDQDTAEVLIGMLESSRHCSENRLCRTNKRHKVKLPFLVFSRDVVM